MDEIMATSSLSEAEFFAHNVTYNVATPVRSTAELEEVIQSLDATETATTKPVIMATNFFSQDATHAPEDDGLDDKMKMLWFAGFATLMLLIFRVHN